jgi:hypothetical protein
MKNTPRKLASGGYFYPSFVPEKSILKISSLEKPKNI